MPAATVINNALPASERDAALLRVTEGNSRKRASRERVAAERFSAQKTAAERATTLSLALTRSQNAQTALDSARADLTSAHAMQSLANSRVLLVHRVTREAAEQAAVSAQSVAVLARTLVQQHRPAVVVDVFLGGHPPGDLLKQLSTLDQLNRATENIETVKARAEADHARAVTLKKNDTLTQAAASTAEVDGRQATFDTAKQEFETAGLAVATAAAQASIAVTALAALDVRPIIRSDIGQLSDKGWASPVFGARTDSYGPRPIRPLAGVGAFHYGTDIGSYCTAPVFAARDGIVKAASALGSYGNWILIDHGEGVQTGYAHLAAGDSLVAVGDRVVGGQQIGRVGSTGSSTGCHTHIEVRIDGQRIDPQPFFLDRGVELGR